MIDDLGIKPCAVTEPLPGQQEAVEVEIRQQGEIGEPCDVPNVDPSPSPCIGSRAGHVRSPVQ